jgi:hypothetical protein
MSLSDELLALSSVEMRRRIGTKEISPVELVEASIARIEALNPAVNAIAATDFAQLDHPRQYYRVSASHLAESNFRYTPPKHVPETLLSRSGAKFLWRELSPFCLANSLRKAAAHMRRHDPGAVRSSLASG